MAMGCDDGMMGSVPPYAPAVAQSGKEEAMRNREARQLTRGETIRPLASAMGYGKFSRRYTYTVAYIGGPAVAPWIVTTDGVRFAPWEIERVDAETRRGGGAPARRQ